MSGTGPNGESFEEMLRSMAGELGRSIEHYVDNLELGEFADSLGVDPTVARDWVESASSWLRAQTESLGEELARRASGSSGAVAGVDPLGGAAPHPLDLLTDEQ